MATRQKPSLPKRVKVPVEWFREEVAFGQKLLGLSDWDITVDVRDKWRDSGDTPEAMCTPHDGHLTCHIVFRQDPIIGEARYNVFHELGHLMFRNWHREQYQIIDDYVGDKIKAEAESIAEKAEEDACERFAHAMVRLTPDRSEPK